MTDALRIRRYRPADLETWNAFVAASKNATFLHDRGFMDYHADRFEDASLIIEADNEPVALLPANRTDDVIQSHGGLTYGGLLTGTSMTAVQMVEIVQGLIEHLQNAGVTRLEYKAIPHIFHAQPAEEDLFALHLSGAQVTRCDLGAAIPMQRRLPLSKGRKSGASKARREGLEVAETQDFAAFWNVLTKTLDTRHGAAPAHTLAEIRMLKDRFQTGVRLFGSFLCGQLLAGIVLLDFGRTVHAQYIAASPEGRDKGALDLLTRHLLEDVFKDRDWFSFGISTTDGGQTLNAGLSRQKEMFGARSVVFQHYALDLA